MFEKFLSLKFTEIRNFYRYRNLPCGGVVGENQESARTKKIHFIKLWKQQKFTFHQMKVIFLDLIPLFLSFYQFKSSLVLSLSKYLFYFHISNFRNFAWLLCPHRHVSKMINNKSLNMSTRIFKRLKYVRSLHSNLSCFIMSFPKPDFITLKVNAPSLLLCPIL